MTSYFLPGEDGWPYPDGRDGEVDPQSEVDEDILAVASASPDLLEHLDALERQVVVARFGLDGTPPRTLRQLHTELGIPREDLRATLGDALAKLRDQLR